MSQTASNTTKISHDAPRIKLPFLGNIRIPIATKLILSFLLIFIISSIGFMMFGVRLVNDLVLTEAQEKVRNDLNAAREIYLSNLTHIDDIVRFTANRYFLREAFLNQDFDLAFAELARIKEEENLDVLAITDRYGYVLVRTCNPDFIGDNQGHDEIIHRALYSKKSAASTVIVNGVDLRKDTPELGEQAHIELIDTPLARPRDEIELTNGMMLKAAAPIFDQNNNL
ncbi:MAG: hypothetical protein ABFS03_13980, partial [Chloroflexota bacterium]